VDVAKETLGLMLAWMYGENIAPKLETPQQRIDLYRVADRYLLEELKKSITTDILRSLSVETAFHIYVLGDTCNEERFKTKGFEFMKRECSRVFANDDVYDECQKYYPKLIQEILKGQGRDCLY